jgi:hypothetical protein
VPSHTQKDAATPPTAPYDDDYVVSTVKKPIIGRVFSSDEVQGSPPVKEPRMARRKKSDDESSGSGSVQDDPKALAKLLRSSAGNPLAIQAIADQLDPPDAPEEEEGDEESTEE